MCKIRNLSFVLLLITLLMPCKLSAFRPMRNYRFDISVNASAGEPSSAYRLFKRPGISYATPPMVSDMYAESVCDIEFSGLYTVRFEAKVAKRLAVGADLSALSMDGMLYTGFDRQHWEDKNGYALYIMPEVRFFYFMTKLTTLSGAVQAGMGIYDGFTKKVSPEFQIIPFSYTLGDRVYGKAELTFGSMMNGITFGVGCRF